jgi:glycine/sarcosine/betaine reductase complex component A
MDLGTQAQVLALSEKGGEQPVVLLGSPDPESAELTALTVTTGDPTFSGPLAGVQLGLPVFHVFESDVESAADATVYEREVGVMREALDVDGIIGAMARVRSSPA